MINLLDTQDSQRMILAKQDVAPVHLSPQTQLDKQITESSQGINIENMKQVDSSSGPLEEEELHLGILSEGEFPPQEASNNQQMHQEEEAQIQNAQINMIVLGEAVAERKAANFKMISGFMQQHIKYYSRHMDVLIDLESWVVARLSKEREFVKEAYSIFYSLNQPQPQHPNPSISSSHVFLEEDKKSTYEKIIDALKNLLIARNEFESSIHSSSSWIDSECLVYLNQIILIHENNLSHYSHEILKYKLQVDERLKMLNLFFKEIEKMIVFGAGGKEVDLLAEEIRFFGVVDDARREMVEWGGAVNTIWLTLQRGELNILNEIKKYVDALFENMGGLFEKNERLEKAREYWVGFSIEEEIKNCYHISSVLAEQNIGMVAKHLGKGSLKNEDFERFSRLEHQRQWIGNPCEIKSLLSLKKFSCKLVTGKGKSDNIIVYSSVDGFAVFTTSQTDRLITSMNLRCTTCTRLSHHMVEVKEKKPGFFKANWNKAELLFASSDEAEEFLVFLAQSLEEAEGIIS